MLKPLEKQLLIQGLEKNKFKSSAEMVCSILRKRDDYEGAEKLRDRIPLFEPHRFWEEQPVP